VNLEAANITETQMRVDMVTKLVAAGFAPDAACEAVGLPVVEFTEPPEPEPVVEPADDPEDEPPVRTIRSVVRDAHGFITAVIDEPVIINTTEES
jgi:hypothetical protein